eukprot:4443911-Prorocentrum_lima.AAC.1
MTSSLVGSEMCIRDRPTELVGDSSRESEEGNLRWLGLDDAHEEEPMLETVSYTHLTLPTICSV